MTKKEEVVDLKPKAEKITDEQLKNVQEVISKMNRTQIEIGSIELKKHELLHGIARLKDDLSKIQAELQEEYGTIDIDVQTGNINYKEDGKADKKD